MGRKKKDDDDKEPTPAQRAVRLGLWAGAIFIPALLILDAARWIAGGQPTLTAKIGLVVAIALVVVIVYRVRRKKRS